jgi:hypothetical protein
VLLLLLAACGSDTGVGDGDGGLPRFAAQQMSNTCAPNDALALRLVLAAEIDSLTCGATDTGESVTITVYTREIRPPQTIQLAGIVADGDAAYCPGGDGPPCRLPVGGEITFTSHEPDVSSTGSFSLDLGDEVIEADFDASWCVPDPPGRCG